MSIAPPVGAHEPYLSRSASSKTYRPLRNLANPCRNLPAPIHDVAKKAENTRDPKLGDGRHLFEELGFYYVGPIDGHDSTRCA
jgi:1-deoxy-D-xylulose-5-phosphate synthase